MSLKAKNSVAFYNHLIKTLPHTQKCLENVKTQ